MENVKKVTIVLTILAAGLVCSSVYGQEEIADDDKWQISLIPYFWAPDTDIKSTISGNTASIDIGFDDIVDNLDELDVFGLSGRLEAWKGDWGFFFDGQHVAIGFDGKLTGPVGFGSVAIDVDIEDTTLDFGAAYKLWKVPLNESRSRMLTIAPLGGVRYHYFKQEVKLKATLGPLANGTKLGGDEEWVEPFVGVQLKYDLTKNLAAGVRADYGGFGIGSASDHTWNFIAGIDWQFKKNMSLKAGYKINDIDYKRHSGAKEFGIDGQFRGPMFGLTILF